jgi:hypothetical protein
MAKKNLIFFIHGIGRHPKGWIDADDGPVKALEAAMALYPDCFSGVKELRDLVDVVEVRYDDIFDDQIERWTDQVKDLPPVGPGAAWVEKLQEIWTRAQNDQKTFTDYGGDVILYCGFDVLARSIRLRVNKIILGEIYKRHKESLKSGETAPDVGIVAHSMGAAVVYDSLYSLFTGSWFAQGDELLASENVTAKQKKHFHEILDEINAPGSKTTVPVRLDMLMMLSNTSSLLTRWDVSQVNDKLGPGAGTRTFLNVNHVLDPIGRLKRFKISSEWDSLLAIDIEPQHLHERNIHAMRHYLSHPAVHGRLFARMIGKAGRFTGLCQTAAIETKPQDALWTGIGGELKDMVEAEVQKLRNKLAEVSTLEDENDVFGLVKRYEAFFRRILRDEP